MNQEKPNLKIKIPDFYCSRERILYLREGLAKGWIVEKSTVTNECRYYNFKEDIYTYTRPKKDIR